MSVMAADVGIAAVTEYGPDVIEAIAWGGQDEAKDVIFEPAEKIKFERVPPIKFERPDAIEFKENDPINFERPDPIKFERPLTKTM